MNLLKRILTITAAACFVCLLSNNSADAHDFLKDPLKEHYSLKSVSCSACHPGSNKAINNAFGMKFKTAFKGKDYTKRVHDAKELKKKDKEAGQKALDVIDVEMVAQFKELIVEIEKESMTFAEMARSGVMNGMKLDADRLEEMRVEQGAAKKK